MRGNHIGLALQGGGSYAAFTSGVLKALFSKRRNFLKPEEVRSISGTSGGALNALLLGQAIHEGRDSPVTYVDKLWQINRLERHLKKRFSSLHLVSDEMLAALIGQCRELAGAYPMLASMHRNDKLKSVALNLVDEMVHQAAPSLPADLDAPLLADKKPYVTVAATEIHSATAHYFTNNTRLLRRYDRLEIAERRHVIKPLCLRGVYGSLAHPHVFKAVEMGEDRYWDGYYTCNPPFMYLFREGCDEVVLVRLVQQERDSIGDSMAAINDRIEEIAQNTALNMEIGTYLIMREMLLSQRSEEVDLKLGLRKFGTAAVYHEIRLLKPGNIADEGYPLTHLVEKLIRLGQKVVADKDGFIAAYRKADKGLHVVSEVCFETEAVRSRVIDIDKVMFAHDKSAEVAEIVAGIGAAEAAAKASGFMRFFRGFLG